MNLFTPLTLILIFYISTCLSVSLNFVSLFLIPFLSIVYTEVEALAHKSEVLDRRKREEEEKLRLPVILQRKNEWWAVSIKK